MRYGPHVRYLLRVMAWGSAMLALWWILLLGPLEATLRFSTELLFRACLWADPPAQMALDAEGRWTIRVPVPAAVARRDEIQQLFGRLSPDAPYVKVRSLRLEIPGRDSALFLATLPFFWALLLPGSGKGRNWRALAKGTVILLPVAVMLMSFDVVRTFILNTHLKISALVAWLLHAGDVAALDVIPYLAPVVLALALDEGLRSSIFSWGPSEPAAAVALPPRHRGSARRGWNKAVARGARSGS